MSRRQGRGRNSQVRGPTSALSSFLRENGIQPPRQNRFQRIPVEEQLGTNAVVTTDGEVTEDAGNTGETIADAVVDEEVTAGEPSNLPSLSRFPSSSKPVKKGKKKADGTDDLEGLLPVGNPKKRLKRDQDESLLCRFCTLCDRRFIHVDLAVSVCQACSLIGANKKQSAMEKRKLKKAQEEVLLATGEIGVVLPLRELCIQFIVDNIEDVEYIASIPQENKLKLAKIISKQRKLDETVLKLFLGDDEDQLELFDCTRLDEAALMNIPNLAPNLEILNLVLCGRLTDKVLEVMGTKLERLSSLSLSGPFLCSAGGFSNFFMNQNNLQKVDLEFASKLTNESLHHLTKECPQLTHLSLTDCSLINDEGIEYLMGVKNLVSLGLNSLGEINDKTFQGLLNAHGKNLVELSLNKQKLLANDTLSSIEEHCKSLESLSLRHCPLVETGELVDTLQAMSPLSSLDISGNSHLEDAVLEVIANKHGKQLSSLVINGLDEISHKGLEFCSELIIHLSTVDVSWIRAVDDTFFHAFMSKSVRLQNVRMFGCNQVSKYLLDKVYFNKDGKRIVVYGNEYD